MMENFHNQIIKLINGEETILLSARRQRLLSFVSQDLSRITSTKFYKRWFMFHETWTLHLSVEQLKKTDYFYLNIPFLVNLFKEKEGEVFLLFHRKTVIGFALLRYCRGGWERKFVAINERYQGEGLSQLLVEETFRFCSVTKSRLKIKKYTDMGLERLDKNNQELAKKYQVELQTVVDHDFYD